MIEVLFSYRFNFPSTSFRTVNIRNPFACTFVELTRKAINFKQKATVFPLDLEPPQWLAQGRLVAGRRKEFNAVRGFSLTVLLPLSLC